MSDLSDWTRIIDDLDAEEERLLLASLPDDHLRVAAGDWPGWAHHGQLAPPACPDGSDWRTWVLKAGRGFGKTLAGAQWIRAAVAAPEAITGEGGGALEIALVGATVEEARRVMVDGRSGLLTVAADEIADWSPTRRLITFKSGARATLFSGSSPDALRGPEHHLAWCDELAKWEKAQDSWDMLQLGLRLGPRPRAMVTTTPRPGPVLSAIMAAPDTVTTGGSTMANPHLSPAYKARIAALYAGTRLGAQEIDGKLLTDAPGALWTVELLERSRLNTPRAAKEGPLQTPLPAREGRSETPLPAREGPGVGANVVSPSPPNQSASPASSCLTADPPPAPPYEGGELTDASWPTAAHTPFTRIVIGVDPPSVDGTCGIVACAKDEAGIALVLADHSVTALSPEGWARAVADAARIHSNQPSPLAGEGDSRAYARERGEGAQQGLREATVEIPTLIVAETNQGGKMVEAILHGADSNLQVRRVTASVGKSHRAEPIARLFEAGKVVLHGRFPELEAQLLGMIAGGGYEGPGQSPDRADAMVWAITELMLKPEKAPRVRGFD